MHGHMLYMVTICGFNSAIQDISAVVGLCLYDAKGDQCGDHFGLKATLVLVSRQHWSVLNQRTTDIQQSVLLCIQKVLIEEHAPL